MDSLLELIRSLFRLLGRLTEFLLDRFMELNFFDRLLIICVIPSFAAVMLPVGKFYIFENWYTLNNPLAIYLIGISIVIFASFIIRPLYRMLIRVLCAGAYLLNLLYIHFSDGFARTEYELSAGFYLNIAVPILIAAFSALSYYAYGREN